jgi:hypothetical protein
VTETDTELAEAAQVERPTYRLTRILFLRFLGGIYLVAFSSLSQQVLPLLGRDGLLPIPWFLKNYAADHGGAFNGFLKLPSIFWLGAPDVLLLAGAYLGALLALLVLLGFANAIQMTVLWALYMSYVHVGQVFYGFGWESLLLETGFLAIFMCPWTRLRPAPNTTPPAILIWLLRWVLFRVMFGAGLIKIRGDSCWRDLTCLYYHYETQPIPNPLSWVLHQMPPWLHKAGVLWNHFVELIGPWIFLVPRWRVAAVGGLIQVAFQLSLILSGNLSWLNWLTITIAISCFDDRALLSCVPKRWRARYEPSELLIVPRGQQHIALGLAAVVAFLSVGPVANLMSSHQRMNSSFNPLQLVNTYGAFGSVSRERYEVILQGTSDTEIGPDTVWREYQLECKPGDVTRRPCVVSPYHYRLDWEIWFAAMSSYEEHPWLVHLIAKLLANDLGALSLLAGNPFPDQPPHAIRAELYLYELTRFGDGSAAWWKRKRVREYLPALTADDPSLRAFIESYGWSKE